MDGSQKIPQRWLETLAHNAANGRTCPAIREGLSAWIHHLQGHNGPVDDPQADKLSRAANSNEPLIALFGEGGLLQSAWRPQEPELPTA